MDIQELIGHNVTHKSFGTGRILSVTETRIEVEFDFKGIKKVQFPQMIILGGLIYFPIRETL